MNSIYSIQPADPGVTLDQVWAQTADGGVAAGYNNLVAVKVGDRTALYAYKKETQTADVYLLTGAAPWVQRTAVQPDLSGGPWDSLSSFVLGNEPYLLAYRSDQGSFGLFHVGTDLSVSKPCIAVSPHSTPTLGFTTVAPYTSLGLQYFAGYSYDTGLVANFSVAVTSTSAGGVPPLQVLNVWYHKWARGWTHFAFFQMGGSNFFFKINREKLNVNIDHMQDNPAAGSVEVGSYLQAKLPDALKIDNTAHIPWADGEPYVLTYIASTGATVVYRIHTDCQGWTCMKSAATVTGATQTVAYRIGGKSFVLFYAA